MYWEKKILQAPGWENAPGNESYKLERGSDDIQLGYLVII
jgi:hypothetical protein